MKILFELKLPQEYLDYDDVENLHYHCINKSSLECSQSELNLKEPFTANDILNIFEEHISNRKHNSIIFKWFIKILKECDRYIVENIQHIDGANFLLSYGSINIQKFDNTKVIDTLEKELTEFDWDAFELMQPKINIDSSDSDGIDQADLEKIQSISQKIIDENLAYWDLETLLRDSGFKVKKQMGHPPRFEIEIDGKLFTVVRGSLLKEDAPSEIEFEVGYLIGFNGSIL